MPIFKDPRQLAGTLKIENPQAAITGGEGGIVAKPTRFTKRPRLEDYEVGDAWKTYKDLYYYHEPEDIDQEIANLTAESGSPKFSDFSRQRLDVLSNPNLQRYLRDRKAFDSQLESDFNDYKATARAEILKKLLGDGDLYRTRYYGGEYRDEKDDIYDSINDAFHKKYGYEPVLYGDNFRLTQGLYSPLEDDEKEIVLDNGVKGHRQKYNKAAYIGELLRSGQLSLDELKNLIRLAK